MDAPVDADRHPVLELGGTRHDLADRALVVALLTDTGAEMSAFSGNGEIDAFVARAEHAIRDGADAVQVGPFHPASVSAPDEHASIRGIVSALRERVRAPVLVSTARAAVAEAGLVAGAVMAEDPFGLTDPRFAAVVAAAGAAVVATAPAASTKAANGTGYARVHALQRVEEELACAAQLAREAGVPADRIVLHPELKMLSLSGARALVTGMPRLVSQGYPVAFEVPDVALTRELVDDPDADDSTATAIAAVGVSLGARVLRARDVTAACRVRDTLAAVCGAR